MDDLSVFTGNANRPLAASICKHLRIPLGDADVFQFSNENIFVKINDNVRGHDVFVIQPFSAPVNRSIMELLIMIDALKRASASRITAVIPYYAYGRTPHRRLYHRRRSASRPDHGHARGPDPGLLQYPRRRTHRANHPGALL